MAVNCVDAVAMLDDVDHLERLLATLNRTRLTLVLCRRLEVSR